MDVSQEIYDVVDADDHVIGKATRREIHEKGLLHRSVHILYLILMENYFSKNVPL
jgi:hypothetical protein